MDEINRRGAELGSGSNGRGGMSRRGFLRGGVAAAMAAPVLKSWGAAAGTRGPAMRVMRLDGDWLFGGKMKPGALDPGFADADFKRVTLPHCAAPLSWRNWDPEAWEHVWVYRRHFTLPREFDGLRVFAHFDRVMEGVKPAVNGHALEGREGGFLPVEREITELVRDENVLAVAVDGRWLDAPPSGSPKGPESVDYLMAAGITGAVTLRAAPQIFIRGVFASPVNVLDAARRLEMKCGLDAAPGKLPAKVRLETKLLDGDRVVAGAMREITIEKPQQDVELTMERLANVALWDVDNPRLYELEVTLFEAGRAAHAYRTRVGFREARFEVEGFFLNGKRLQIFGLNRHEIFPYRGFAMPDRVMRRDAEILRREFNCNMVRCSHYPQAEAFLDACDELGLMVWEETPGWQYLGDAKFKERVVRDVREMVLRDRNHAAIVIWGVRVNESHNDPELYGKTRQVAKELDPTRQTSGTMTPWSRKEPGWHQDVYAYDDYEAAPDGSVDILPPVDDYPYLIAEAVGQFDYSGKGFARKYRRAADAGLQAQQALLHAQAHSKAAANRRISGVIAWCAFDYASLMNAWETIKCPGVADVFRIPKLGASFYLSQVDAKVRAVIEPDFWWDFGVHTPAGPGKHAAIFSNCERLEVYLDGKLRARLEPDRRGFGGLKYPPFFADLTAENGARPELRIDGFVGGTKVLTRSFSADRGADRLWVRGDDAELAGNGVDATRVAFGVEDKFGALRAFAEGEVELEVAGPGEMVGDRSFRMEDCGGAAAVWVKSTAGQTGVVRVTARHSSLEAKTVEIRVT